MKRSFCSSLVAFYDLLNDEQKERFNAIGPKQPKDSAEASQASAQDGKTCSEPKAGLTNLPIERIEDVIKPTDAQEDGLKQLEDATAKAVSIMQAACPEDTPITPPGRLEAMEKRLAGADRCSEYGETCTQRLLCVAEQ